AFFQDPGGIFAPGSFHDLPGLLWAGTDRPQEAPDPPNLVSHGLAQVHALATPAPMPEIAVALAPRSARASCPSVHAAACPTCYRCLSTGVTGSRPRSPAPSFGQIREAVVRCQPDVWGRVSFLTTPLSIAGWIDDPDHS